MIQSANEKGPSISSLLPEFGSSRSNTKPRELPDLSGKWEVSTEVTSSTYTAYHGLVMYYDVGVSQTGNIIQMAGEKDGEREPDSVRVVYEGKARTTILGEGEIAIGEGGLASIAIISEENGTKRRIKTVFVLTEVESGSLQGTFRSEAAAHSRQVKARIPDSTGD
jgi:hypothetical protein